MVREGTAARQRSILRFVGSFLASAVQYCWFFVVNFVFVWILIIFGSGINLSFFRRTDYSFQAGGAHDSAGGSCCSLTPAIVCVIERSRCLFAGMKVASHCLQRRVAFLPPSRDVRCFPRLQFVLYLLWINCLIAFSFLLSSVFRSSKTGAR